MANHTITAGNTAPRITVKLRSSTTGMGLTSIAYGSVTAWYFIINKDGSSSGPTTIGTGAHPGTNTVNGSWSSATWVEIDATKQPGDYQFDIPVGCVAANVRECRISITATGAIDASEVILTTAVDLQDAVRLGMTSLPNATAGGAAGLIVQGTGSMGFAPSGGNVTLVSGYDAAKSAATVAQFVAAIAANGHITVLSPVQNGSLSIVQGDQYTQATSRQLIFSKQPGANWPTDISVGTITLYCRINAKGVAAGGNAAEAFTATGTVIQATGDGQQFYIAIATAPALTAVGFGNYDVQVRLEGAGAQETLFTGILNLLRKVLIS